MSDLRISPQTANRSNFENLSLAPPETSPGRTEPDAEGYIAFAQEALKALVKGISSLVPEAHAAEPASAVPNTIRHMGRLLAADDKPATGTHTFTFNLYEDKHGESLIWTGDFETVVDLFGNYSVNLGDANNLLPAKVMSGEARWLGIQVDGEVQMTPLLEFGSTPYAFRAGEAASVKGGTIEESTITNSTITGGSLTNVTIDATEINATSIKINNEPVGVNSVLKSGDTMTGPLTAPRFISTTTTEAPLSVASAARVDNLNAQFLDGHPANDFLTIESDTLQSVTARGNVTDQIITVGGLISQGNVGIQGGNLVVGGTNPSTITGNGEESQIRSDLGMETGARIIWYDVDAALTNQLASITSLGLNTFDIYDSTSSNIASINVGQITGNKTFTLPNQSGTFVLADTAGNVSVAGAIRPGTANDADCATGTAGALRWSGGNIQVCDGTGWRTLQTVQPLIFSVIPNSGSMTGGTPITINGSNFIQGASVLIGSASATNVNVVSAVQITAKTPSSTTIGAKDLKVTNPDGSFYPLPNAFTYFGDGSIQALAAPTCKAIKESNATAADGVYWLDPNGGNTSDAFQAVCNMTRDGGGWTLGVKSWYTRMGDGSDRTSGAVGSVADALTRKGNIYKLSDDAIRAIIGPNQNFDIMGDQNGYNSSYSSGNYEYVIVRNYTARWSWVPSTPASTTTTTMQSYRISDNALAWTGNLACGYKANCTDSGTRDEAGINCYDVISNNPQAGCGCSINMGSSGCDTGHHHFFMSHCNTDTYLYICNGPQHSSNRDMNHRWWFRER